MASKKGSIQATILTGTTGLAIAPLAAVEVRVASSGSLAALWDDRDSSSGVANPFNADADGHFKVYATPGRYTVTSTVGAQVITFDDVIVLASENPEPSVPIMRASPTSGQSVTSITAFAAVLLDTGTTESYDAGYTALAASGAGITAVALGALLPGHLDIDYQINFSVKDGAGASITGDIIEAMGAIHIGGALVATSQAYQSCAARTGATNAFSLSGHAFLEVDGTTAPLIELMVGMSGRSSGTLQMDIIDSSHITVRRTIENVA